MTSKSTNRKVSLAPSDCVEPGIIELTAGDVIKQFRGIEAKRRRDGEEYGQCDVPLSVRSTPDGLLEALDDISDATGTARSVVTKCLSHHAMAWYQDMPQVKLLSRMYRLVQAKSDGFPDVIRRIKKDDYEFVRPVGDSAVIKLRSIGFIVGYFGDICNALGIPAYKLLLSGMCWSISTNTDSWCGETVKKFLTPEADNIKAYLGERILSLDYADKVIKFRRRDKDVLKYVEGLGDGSWDTK